MELSVGDENHFMPLYVYVADFGKASRIFKIILVIIVFLTVKYFAINKDRCAVDYYNCVI